MIYSVRDDDKSRILYSYWENNIKIAIGTIKELSSIVNKTENYLRVLYFKPTKRRCIKVEGYIYTIFEIYKIDGEIVFTGTKEECEEFLGLTYPIYGFMGDMKRGDRSGRCGGYLVRRTSVRQVRES